MVVLVGTLVVALVALGVVLFFQLSGDEGSEAAAPQTRPADYKVRDAGNMNEVLASREIDGRVLNEGELFERRNAEISSQSIDFTLEESELTDDCSSTVWGEQATQALADAECSQAGRAAYLSDNYFGVATVFNLADVEGSRAVAEALNLPEPEGGEPEEEIVDPGFVLPPSGAEPFDRLGSGYSAADAIVSGHYLVVVWVQPTDSDSVDERVTLSTPLVALANFRDPLFRRMIEYDDDESTGTEGTEGTEETGGEPGTEPGTEEVPGEVPGQQEGLPGEAEVPAVPGQ